MPELETAEKGGRLSDGMEDVHRRDGGNPGSDVVIGLKDDIDAIGAMDEEVAAIDGDLPALLGGVPEPAGPVAVLAESPGELVRGGLGGENLMEIPADNLVAMPAVKVLGAAVPKEDFAAGGADDDGVMGKLEELGLLAQLLGEAVLIGDIHADAGALPSGRAEADNGDLFANPDGFAEFIETAKLVGVGGSVVREGFGGGLVREGDIVRMPAGDPCLGVGAAGGDNKGLKMLGGDLILDGDVPGES